MRPISGRAACTRTCSPELIDDIEDFCDPFLKVLRRPRRPVMGNRIFKQRNVDIGVVSLDEAGRGAFRA